MYLIIYGRDGHFLYKCKDFANLMTNAQDFMAGDHKGNCISSAIFATFILACTNKESIILLL